MSGSARTLDAALLAVRALAEHAASATTDEGLVDGLELWESIGRLVDAQRAAFAAELAERSRSELGEEGLAATLGHRRPADLLEARLLISKREARHRIDLGTALAERKALDGTPLPSLFPVLAQAVRAGEVGLEVADRIRSMLQSVAARAHPEDLVAAEEALTDLARTIAPDSLRPAIEAWRAALDPDGAEPNEGEQQAKRRFAVGRERSDGMVPFAGLATSEAAAMIRAALNAHRVKDRPEPLADGTPAPVDERTRPQFDFDTLMGILGAGTRAEAQGAGGMARTTHEVVVTVSAADLVEGSGAGWLDFALGGLGITSVQRLMCDGVTRYLVTGDRGEPLKLQRNQRRFNLPQRRAMAAQTGGCTFPGCTAPPAWCDAHHADEWNRDDGATDVDNGVLLCPYHHRWIHLHRDHRFEFRDGVPVLVQQRWADEAPNLRAANRHRALLARELQQRRRRPRVLDCAEPRARIRRPPVLRT